MTIGTIIKNRRIEIGLSVDELANLIGKNRATIYRYESAEIEKLPINVLEPLAKALRTTPAELMGWEKPQYPDNIIKIPDTKDIPLIGSIACGKPILAEENIEYYIKADTTIPADFALKCCGDSMINARIFDGDIVYIRQQPDVDNGEIAAVLIGNEATLKKVHKFPSKIVLSPCNPMYEDLVYSNEQLDDIRILGKAVAFTSIIR